MHEACLLLSLKGVVQDGSRNVTLGLVPDDLERRPQGARLQIAAVTRIPSPLEQPPLKGWFARAGR